MEHTSDKEPDGVRDGKKEAMSGGMEQVMRDGMAMGPQFSDEVRCLV